MKCKVKNDICQVNDTDFTAGEVSLLLRMRRQYVYDHRDLFTHYYLPGRGRTGQALRFDRESVLRYRRERIRAARDASNPYEGKTIEEIAKIAKERTGRRSAVGSGS